MNMTTLAMWTVYKNPTDYPDKFVARRFDVDAGGAKPSDSIIVAPDLDKLRDVLQFEMGLVKLMRSPGDEPQIMETWL
jgi:hypothetical protein